MPKSADRLANLPAKEGRALAVEHDFEGHVQWSAAAMP